MELSLSPRARLAACGASGALMACATPPMNVYPMAWLGMVALYFLLDDGPLPAKPKVRDGLRGVLRVFVFAVGTNLVALRFASVVVTRFATLPSFVGPIALLILAAFEATRWLSVALANTWLPRLGVPRTLAFAIGVYAGTFVPTMIPWTVACGVCPWPATVQLAEVMGERGVAFLMALEAALVSEGVRLVLERKRATRPLAIAGALLVVTLVYGAVRIHQIDALRTAAPSASIAIVEPAVEATERWDAAEAHTILVRLTGLTLRAEHDGAELVIWPEDAYPYDLAHVTRRSPPGPEAILQPGVRGPVLVGLIMAGAAGRYNSAIIATRDGKLSEPYDKMHLMWFGEMVPFEDEIPWLREAFSRGIGLRAGEHQMVMEAGSVRMAVLDCLEDILPSAGREAIATGPNLLVNITNDAWFAGTAESEYHLLLSRLRAVELRRDLVRAVNFGPTTWVDAAGRVLARIPVDQPGVLMTRPALLDAPMTPFARWGEWPLSLALSAYSVSRGVAKRRRAAS
ncbi:MAG: apolipoprotein N-acyltransferase [Polyangiaceae bacterium]